MPLKGFGLPTTNGTKPFEMKFPFLDDYLSLLNLMGDPAISSNRVGIVMSSGRSLSTAHQHGGLNRHSYMPSLHETGGNGIGRLVP